jgi:hypothetical protein
VDDGLALVRVGRPVFPEYASWRYGERFAGRRRREMMIGAGIGALGLSAMVWGPAVLGIGGGMGYFFYQTFTAAANGLRGRKVLGVINDEKHGDLRVTGSQAEIARLITRRRDELTIELVPPRTWPLLAEPKGPTVTIEGNDARRFLRMALPFVNRAGAKDKVVIEAIDAMGLDRGYDDPLLTSGRELDNRGFTSSRLFEIPPMLRIGMEMAAFEDQERRWLETELDLLAVAWREAEELAAVADDLTFPDWVTERVEALRKEPGSP